MQTEASREMEMDGKLMVMAQSSRPGPRSGKSAMDEEVIVVHEFLKDKLGILDHGGDDNKQDEIHRGKSGMPMVDLEFKSEDVNKAMVESDKLLSGPPAGPNSIHDSVHDDLEMMGIRPEMQMQLYEAMRRALLDIQDKLGREQEKKKKNKKTAMETLQQLLKVLSNRLDQGGDGDQNDEMDDRGPADPSATNSIHDSVQEDVDDHHRGKSATTLAKKTADEEAERFASYRRRWETSWRETCGLFEEITVLSSMQLTHYIPDPMEFFAGSNPETLQIFSIKLTELAGGLEFPLSVYGVVAVRDIADRNRNLLFSRGRSEMQVLTENDPFLHLIGPSRAVVFTDKVCIEIELKVEGDANCYEKALIRCAQRYSGGYGPGVSKICFKNFFCTLELCSQPVKDSVQATILGIQVAKDCESWPFKYGGLVACTPLSGKIVFSHSGFTQRIYPSSSKIVLLDSKDGPAMEGAYGYVHLRRQVISVELQGRLDVFIEAYSKSGGTAAKTSVSFMPKVCNISQMKCSLGDDEVTITVAWSLVATCKSDLALEVSGRRYV